MRLKAQKETDKKALRAIKNKIITITIFRIVLAIDVCAFIAHIVMDYPYKPSAAYGLISVAIVVVCSIFGKVNIDPKGQHSKDYEGVLKDMKAKYKNMKN